jgi:hypothetical protein
MKELKFRQPIYENGKITRWHIWEFRDGLYQLLTNQHESDQFICKLDSNLKEIFENDIVERKSGERYRVVYNPEYAQFWLEHLRLNYYADFMELTSFKESVTIIGNSREHPNLLKTRNKTIGGK